MRHGVTELNVSDCWQGLADSPLTELGRQQAAEAGAHIREAGIEPDRVWCSPLGRVLQTLACALPELADGGYTVDDDLAEISFGSYDGQQHREGDPRSPYGDFFVDFGGESEAQVEKRVCAAMERIAADPAARDVLVVSHGTVGRVFRDHWAALARVEAPRHLANCSIYTYEYDDEARTFSLVDVYEPDCATNPEDFMPEKHR